MPGKKDCDRIYRDLKRLPRDAQRLDVRSREEYEKGHAEGFHLLIPLEELRSRLQELNQEKPVYLSLIHI